MEVAEEIARKAVGGFWKGAMLRVEKNGKERGEAALEKEIVVVGRKKKSCDFVVDHGSVSKIHAALVPVIDEKGTPRCVVIDLGSSQGTFVNGKKLVPKLAVPLESVSDEVRFGTSSKSYFLKEMNPRMSREDEQAAISRLATKMVSEKAKVQKEPALQQSCSSKLIESDESLWRDLPLSRSVRLEKHEKAVRTIAIDTKGARFVTGGDDEIVKLFDFGGMNQEHQAFKSFQPVQGYPIRYLSFNPSGSAFLVATAHSSIRVFSRDAEQQEITKKGDPYLADMNKTKGHPSVVTCAEWSPVEAAQFLSSGNDGTVRIWDIQNGPRFMIDNSLISHKVMKAKSSRNTRLGISCAAWSPLGDRIAAGCSDGSVQLWAVKTKGDYTKPDAIVRPGHAMNHDITCVKFSPDGKLLASRSQDDTLKVWDVRNLKSPVAKIWEGFSLENRQDCLNLEFSPDGSILLTGETGKSNIVCFQTNDFSKEKRFQIDDAFDPICLKWHPKLNQVFVGCNGGESLVMFDTELSEGGVLVSSAKAPSKKRDAIVAERKITSDQIILPNALPMFRKEKKKSRKEQRKDAATLMKPSAAQNLSGDPNLGKHQKEEVENERDIRHELLAHAGTNGRKDAIKRKHDMLAAMTMEEEEEERKRAKTLK